MINGTPILDIKPYIPSYDAVPNAQLPEWCPIEEKTQNEPLHIAKVTISPSRKEEMRHVWRESYQKEQTCFESFGDFYSCVQGSLLRDMRSTYRRLKDSSIETPDVVYRLVVDRALVSYVIDNQKRVTVTDVQNCDVQS